jgi:PIN domain nuclease of toxin-antitoxin system
MAVQAETRKFKVAEFYKLGEVGILSKDDPVELLDGQIMIMAPVGENHRTVVDALAEILTDRREALGKLSLEDVTIEGLVDAAAAHHCELLPLTAEVASTFHHLPLLGKHRDPFDRMLVWQAIQHDLTLVSRDRVMEPYQTEGLKILW